VISLQLASGSRNCLNPEMKKLGEEEEEKEEGVGSGANQMESGQSDCAIRQFS
jgi:hypothetical protein